MPLHHLHDGLAGLSSQAGAAYRRVSKKNSHRTGINCVQRQLAAEQLTAVLNVAAAIVPNIRHR